MFYVYVYVYISANQLLIEDGICNIKPPLKHRHQTWGKTKKKKKNSRTSGKGKDKGEI